MFRDLTMIFAVMVSVVSAGFGVYKNFQAHNNEAFIYQQAYQIIGQIEAATLPSSAKKQLVSAALGVLGTPAPVIDLSQSSAATPIEQICSNQKIGQCATLASDMASANAACARSKGVSADCMRAQGLREDIITQQCVSCYAK